MHLDVAVHRAPDGGKEILGAERMEEAVALELVLHRPLHLGEHELHAGGVQRTVQLAAHVGRGEVHVGHRLRRDNHPARRRRRVGHRGEKVIAEDLGIGEEERRIPADGNGCDATLDCAAEHIVVAADGLHAGRTRVRLPVDAPVAASGTPVLRHRDGEDEYVYSLFVPAAACALFACFSRT